MKKICLYPLVILHIKYFNNTSFMIYAYSCNQFLGNQYKLYHWFRCSQVFTLSILSYDILFGTLPSVWRIQLVIKQKDQISIWYSFMILHNNVRYTEIASRVLMLMFSFLSLISCIITQVVTIQNLFIILQFQKTPRKPPPTNKWNPKDPNTQL